MKNIIIIFLFLSAFNTKAQNCVWENCYIIALDVRDSLTNEIIDDLDIILTDSTGKPYTSEWNLFNFKETAIYQNTDTLKFGQNYTTNGVYNIPFGVGNYLLLVYYNNYPEFNKNGTDKIFIKDKKGRYEESSTFFDKDKIEIMCTNNPNWHDQKSLDKIMITIKLIDKNEQTSCHYPFEQLADSLINFVIAESGSKGIIGKWSGLRSEYKEIGHEYAFKECIKDLRNKIGDSLICTNIKMNTMYSFDIKPSFRNVYTLTFLYTIPVINEPIYVTYTYNSDINGEAKVLEYPRNFPTLSIEEINITREDVIEILKSRNIIANDDSVSMYISGNWWIIHIQLADDDMNYKRARVNIKTGELNYRGIKSIIDE